MDDTRIKVLCGLAHLLRSRHLETFDEAILDDCITFATEVIASTTPFNPESGLKSKYHVDGRTTLAKALRSKYQLHGDVENLDKAIEHVQESMYLQSQIPFSTRNDAVELVNQFALMMRSRFDERGELGDLDTAIQYVQGILKGQFPNFSSF
jgi:hypothetical protein